ncbi:MAG: hypothetical protein MSK63_07420 [Clostridiales bacterium]|nr:hypothetical protein [Clostridiales bacterium]
MYNSQEIAKRIKQRAKYVRKPLGEVLASCGLGVNTVSKMSHGTDILTLNFAKIADCLDCSVDYLLGRTDNPEINLNPCTIDNPACESNSILRIAALGGKTVKKPSPASAETLDKLSRATEEAAQEENDNY